MTVRNRTEIFRGRRNRTAPTCISQKVQGGRAYHVCQVLSLSSTCRDVPSARARIPKKVRWRGLSAWPYEYEAKAADVEVGSRPMPDPPPSPNDPRSGGVVTSTFRAERGEFPAARLLGLSTLICSQRLCDALGLHPVLRRTERQQWTQSRSPGKHRFNPLARPFEMPLEFKLNGLEIGLQQGEIGRRERCKQMVAADVYARTGRFSVMIHGCTISAGLAVLRAETRTSRGHGKV
jgi:hypothetical protein